MKVLIVMSLIVLAYSAAANVECSKKNGRWYPKNATAKKIALSLNVKTCSGGRFKDVVAKLGMKSNVPATKSRMSVDELVATMKGAK